MMMLYKLSFVVFVFILLCRCRQRIQWYLLFLRLGMVELMVVDNLSMEDKISFYQFVNNPASPLLFCVHQMRH